MGTFGTRGDFFKINENLIHPLVDYLLNRRLRWGQPDTQSLLTSAIADVRFVALPESEAGACAEGSVQDPPAYFCWETPSKYISIIQNDWPYSGKLRNSVNCDSI